jgi:dihydroorotase
LVNKFTVKPAEVLGIAKPEIREGREAALIVFDPAKEWVVEENDFFSKSKNSCFLGKRLKGKIEMVFYKGRFI